MSNPPLSLLSDDLFAYIVDHVAELLCPNEHLCNLSIADRAFTWLCQSYIFKDLCLGYNSGTKTGITKKLELVRKILNDEPSFANRVRMVELTISHKRNGWLFSDPTFISIIQLLAKSPMSPHTLYLTGLTHSFTFKDPILTVGRLMQSFFSQTLTVLHLTGCENIPVTLFLICPKLREILLDNVQVTERSYDTYPDEQCSGRDFPALERLDYRNPESLVKQMITPPPRFHTAEKEEMACLQPILDGACNTLEELYLTNIRVARNVKQLPLTGIMNLRDLSCLRVFRLRVIIKCGVKKPTVLRDIKFALSTISISNKITNLSFKFIIAGEYPFRGCLKEDWVGICNEVVRISAGKALEFDLKTAVCPPTPQLFPPEKMKCMSASWRRWHCFRTIQIFIPTFDIISFLIALELGKETVPLYEPDRYSI